MSDTKEQIKNSKPLYFSMWRWHFYAGLFVFPFLVMLSLTGLAMLYSNSIESFRYSDILDIEPKAVSLSPTQQLQKVKEAYPKATIKKFLLPENESRASRFDVKTEDGRGIYVTINPYSGEILGEIDRSKSTYVIADDIHGTLLIGDIGDRLIEIAASLSVLLLITGIYLWLPKDKSSRSGFLKIRRNKGKRTFWRDLHANIGILTSVFLLFFLITGLAWAGIWGGKFVQSWSSYPEQVYNKKPVSDKTHASLSYGNTEEVPWNLEQTKMPASGSNEGKTGVTGKVDLSSIIDLGYKIGMSRFVVHLPKGEEGVFTLMASTMGGDVEDARNDRTVHIDQYTGKILADIGWEDYNLMAKSLAFSIGLHKGNTGIINLVINTLLCVLFIFLSLGGAIMWWLRRPKDSQKLGAPPVPKGLSSLDKKIIVAIAVIVSILFPLAGFSIIFILILDYFFISRIPKLKAFFY